MISFERRSAPMHLEASIEVECNPVDLEELNKVTAALEEIEASLREVGLGHGMDVEVHVDVQSQPSEVEEVPLLDEEPALDDRIA